MVCATASPAMSCSLSQLIAIGMFFPFSKENYLSYKGVVKMKDDVIWLLIHNWEYSMDSTNCG